MDAPVSTTIRRFFEKLGLEQISWQLTYPNPFRPYFPLIFEGWVRARDVAISRCKNRIEGD